jgi:four helix bundle protein
MREQDKIGLFFQKLEFFGSLHLFVPASRKLILKMGNIIVEKTFSFAVGTVKLCTQIQEKQQQYIITKQLFRSSTAIGAMVLEAQNAESKRDFVHKLGIAQKECAETIYWLRLLHECAFISETQFVQFHEEAQEIIKILRSIIITTKKRIEK